MINLNKEKYWRDSLLSTIAATTELLKNPVAIKQCIQFSDLVIETLRSSNNIFVCGNGGSHCDSMHFATEFTGRYRKDRPPFGVLALGDPSNITCVANDFGFEHIFERQIRGLGKKNDLLIGISTSGNSKNVIRAFESSKLIGIKTVALLGKDGGILKNMADLSIVVPAHTPERIQEIHIKILHIIVEAVERELLPDQYI